MISQKDRKIIKECAMKYRVSKVLLFGSSLHYGRPRDIDLAVKGISPKIFFRFYSELYKYLDKPVDLIDLDDADSHLVKRILEAGKVIYAA